MGIEDDKSNEKEEEKQLKKSIGKRFRQLRQGEGLFQEEMAERIGRSVKQIYNYESGESGIPDLTKIEIRKQFKISIDELIMGDEAHIDPKDEESFRKMSNKRLSEYVTYINNEMLRRLNEQ